jgi:iron complex transport system permease protein
MSMDGVMATADVAAQRRAGVMAALLALVVLLLLVSLGTGPVHLSPSAVIDALFGGGSDVQQVIVREIRLPRTILGFAIGAILGLSGAALQGLLRNPLASPSLFGAPQSAAFGAVLVIALGLADVRSWALPVAAIVAAFASVCWRCRLSSPAPSSCGASATRFVRSASARKPRKASAPMSGG